jgi:hypothetical protein
MPTTMDMEKILAWDINRKNFINSANDVSTKKYIWIKDFEISQIIKEDITNSLIQTIS